MDPQLEIETQAAPPPELPPNVKVVPISVSGVAMDGRGFSAIYDRQVAETTRYLIQTRNLKPPLRPYHEQTTTKVTPDGQSHVVATNVNAEKACGVLLDCWTVDDPAHPGEVVMQGKIEFTGEGLADYQAGLYQSFSIGPSLLGFTRDGKITGPYVEHVAACGANPPAFPEATIGPEFEIGDQKKKTFLQKMGVQKLRTVVRLRDTGLYNQAENGIMDQEAKKALKVLSGKMGQYDADLKEMRATIKQLLGDDSEDPVGEPGGDGPPPMVPGPQEPSPDKGDDNEEVRLKAENINLQKTEALESQVASLMRDKVEATMNTLGLAQDMRPYFLQSAKSMGLDKATEMFSKLPKVGPPTNGLPAGQVAKQRKPGDEGTIEDRMNDQFPDLHLKGIDLSEDAIYNTFPHLKLVKQDNMRKFQQVQNETANKAGGA